MSFNNGILKPVLKENIDPKKFANLSKGEQANIKSAKFNLPAFGKKGFGSFSVEYNTPILRKDGELV